MSKSLHSIQTLAIIGKILSQIIFVCCTIGAAGCLVGLVALLGLNGIVIGGTNIRGLIMSESAITYETIIFTCISGFIACSAECVLSKFANVYFKHELTVGTPFTTDGAKEIFRLGILTIAIPVGALILEEIAFGIYSTFFSAAEQINMEDMTSVGLGVMFIVLSVIFKYGAELESRYNL